MAVDEVETQTSHNLSALMQVYEQLLKTSIDTAEEKDFAISLKNLASSYVILAKLRLEEIEYVVLYSINQRGAAESDKVGIARHGDLTLQIAVRHCEAQGPRATNRVNWV